MPARRWARSTRRRKPLLPTRSNANGEGQAPAPLNQAQASTCGQICATLTQSGSLCQKLSLGVGVMGLANYLHGSGIGVDQPRPGLAAQNEQDLLTSGIADDVLQTIIGTEDLGDAATHGRSLQATKKEKKLKKKLKKKAMKVEELEAENAELQETVAACEKQRREQSAPADPKGSALVIPDNVGKLQEPNAVIKELEQKVADRDKELEKQIVAASTMQREIEKLRQEEEMPMQIREVQEELESPEQNAQRTIVRFQGQVDTLEREAKEKDLKLVDQKLKVEGLKREMQLNDGQIAALQSNNNQLREQLRVSGGMKDKELEAVQNQNQDLRLDVSNMEEKLMQLNNQLVAMKKLKDIKPTNKELQDQRTYSMQKELEQEREESYMIWKKDGVNIRVRRPRDRPRDHMSQSSEV